MKGLDIFLFLLLSLCAQLHSSQQLDDSSSCSSSSSPSSSSGSYLDINNKGHKSSKNIINMAGVERERSFIMIKPDGVQRGLVGDIIKRFEQKGLKLVAMKFMWASEDLLKEHYGDLSSKPFFNGLVKYMQTGPVVPMVWEGLNVVKTGRQMLGETNPAASLPGTIRGDFCIEVGRNIIHGSDGVESAKKEINLWFKPEELVKWKSNEEPWIYE